LFPEIYIEVLVAMTHCLRSIVFVTLFSPLPQRMILLGCGFSESVCVESNILKPKVGMLVDHSKARYFE